MVPWYILAFPLHPCPLVLPGLPCQFVKPLRVGACLPDASKILPPGPWTPISDPLTPKQKYSAVVAHSALQISAHLEWMFRCDWLACSQTCLGDPQDIIIAPVYPCKVSGHATELYTSHCRRDDLTSMPSHFYEQASSDLLS